MGILPFRGEISNCFICKVSSYCCLTVVKMILKLKSLLYLIYLNISQKINCADFMAIPVNTRRWPGAGLGCQILKS